METEVKFDSKVFSTDAVKSACYKFLDRFSPSINVHDDEIVCVLRFEPSVPESSIAGEVENLKKEVLDQELRQQLRRETEPIRNIILAHAFSKTGLIAD